MERQLPVRRDGAIDLAKSLAMCAVLFIHCSAGHFANFTVGANRWLAADFYGSVSRWAVPVFLMCSGALMNDPARDLPLKKLFSRYVLRLLAAFAAWSVFYEVFRISIRQESAPVGELLAHAAENLFYCRPYYHLYFFYFVFALYFTLPLTRLAAKFASAEEMKYILLAWMLAGGVLRFLKYFWPLNQSGDYSLKYFVLSSGATCPGLGLLGWYMRCHPPKSWTSGLLLFTGGLAVTVLGTWRRSAAAGTLDIFYLDAFALFVLVMGVGVFRLCQWAAAHWEQPPEAVRFLSSASFCVYLVHPVFQHLAAPDWFLSMPVYWSVPLQVLVLLILSLAVYWLLSRIPAVRRWLI